MLLNLFDLGAGGAGVHAHARQNETSMLLTKPLCSMLLGAGGAGVHAARTQSGALAGEDGGCVG